MKKDDCIFCKLANGIILTNSIYEDDDFKVILDASPAAKGHALILPKEHFDNLYETDDAVAEKILPLAKKIAKQMKEKLHCDGVNVLQNNEVAAGQTVFHLHVHLIPRTTGDDAILEWNHLELSDEEMKEIKDKLSF